jgi:hypothetical protein
MVGRAAVSGRLWFRRALKARPTEFLLIFILGTQFLLVNPGARHALLGLESGPWGGGRDARPTGQEVF